MKKQHTILSAMLLVTIFAAGCSEAFQRKLDKWMGNLPEPTNVITIHQIVKYPRASKIEKKIATFSGRSIWINVNSLVHSNVIKKIEMVPRKNSEYYDLHLFMNRKGRMRWMQLSAGFKTQPLAFVIDGTFYRSFIPKPLVGSYDDKDGKTYVVIEGPFDKGTADALVKTAPNNFLYFNDSEDEEF